MGVFGSLDNGPHSSEGCSAGGARSMRRFNTDYAYTESLKSMSNCRQTVHWTLRIAGGGLHLTGTAPQCNKAKHLVQASRQPGYQCDSVRPGANQPARVSVRIR